MTEAAKAANAPAWADREAFLRRIGENSQFYHLFDHLPGVAFFAKDERFRLMAASLYFLQRLGLKHEREIVGRDDFSLFPHRLAEAFRRDDEEVLSTGKPKLRIVELFLNRQGIPDWYITNKLPVRDAEGKVIGIMGTVEEYGGRKEAQGPAGPLEKAVAHIRANYREPVSIRVLARLSGLSERQLNRRFQETFGSSPRDFILKTRILSACDILASGDMPIHQIAQDLGFCDQSSFTRHFRRIMGATPRRYRLQAKA